jgi:hypothetical protein
VKSVADQLRRDLAAQVRALSIDERFEMIARLAEEDLAAFQAAAGLSREDALRELIRRRQVGRQPSRVAAAFDDLPPT